MPDPFDWYLSALEMVGDYGVLSREQCAELGVHEGEPHCGWWRVPPGKRGPRKDDPEFYVAIWHDGFDMRATWAGEPVDPCLAWAWCCRYPISEERFLRMEAQRPARVPFGIFAGDRSNAATLNEGR